MTTRRSLKQIPSRHVQRPIHEMAVMSLGLPEPKIEYGDDHHHILRLDNDWVIPKGYFIFPDRFVIDTQVSNSPHHSPVQPNHSMV